MQACAGCASAAPSAACVPAISPTLPPTRSPSRPPPSAPAALPPCLRPTPLPGWVLVQRLSHFKCTAATHTPVCTASSSWSSFAADLASLRGLRKLARLQGKCRSFVQAPPTRPAASYPSSTNTKLDSFLLPSRVPLSSEKQPILVQGSPQRGHVLLDRLPVVDPYHVHRAGAAHEQQHRRRVHGAAQQRQLRHRCRRGGTLRGGRRLGERAWEGGAGAGSPPGLPACRLRTGREISWTSRPETKE